MDEKPIRNFYSLANEPIFFGIRANFSSKIKGKSEGWKNRKRRKEKVEKI